MGTVYFNIDVRQRHHSFSELVQRPGYTKTLNIFEKFRVLEEQLRPMGLQPIMYPDNSGFEIQPACKKFLQQRGCHSRSQSIRELAYMEHCKMLDMYRDVAERRKHNESETV